MISEQTALAVAHGRINWIRRASAYDFPQSSFDMSHGIVFGMQLAMSGSESEWIVQGWSNEAQFLAYYYMRGQ